MSCFIALLRAVNVGGTGKLSMSELKAMCEKAGFTGVRTYIASGNVVLHGDVSAAEVKIRLEASLKTYAGKPVGVLVRTATEMTEILRENPFAQHPGNRTVAIFLDDKPPRDALDRLSGRNDEEASLGRREIYVFFPSGMGRSKLKIPAARDGTARNVNTITRLAEMASADSG